MRSGRAQRVNSAVQLSPPAASPAQHPFECKDQTRRYRCHAASPRAHAWWCEARNPCPGQRVHREVSLELWWVFLSEPERTSRPPSRRRAAAGGISPPRSKLIRINPTVLWSAFAVDAIKRSLNSGCACGKFSIKLAPLLLREMPTMNIHADGINNRIDFRATTSKNLLLSDFPQHIFAIDDDQFSPSYSPKIAK